MCEKPLKQKLISDSTSMIWSLKLFKNIYLGLVITSHLDLKESGDALVLAGSRSLGSLISKYYGMGGMDYATYTKELFLVLVWLLPYRL